MKNEWKEFHKSNRKGKFLFPSITITLDKSIVFNKPFVEKYLKKSQHVRVSYNEKRKLIGLKISDRINEFAYKVSIIKRTGIGILRLKRFFDYFKIEIKEKFHVKAEKDKKFDGFIIDLKEEKE